MSTGRARFEMIEGKESDTLEAVREMVAAVKANEPGCRLYTVSRGQVDGSELYCSEIYADEGAFEDHGRSDHMREMRATMDETIDRGSFNVESLHQIGGFVRHEMEHIA